MLCNKHAIFVAAYAFITEIVIITYVNIYNTPTNLKKLPQLKLYYYYLYLQM